MPSKLETGIKAIPRGQPYGLSMTVAAPELPARAGALPERLQDIARNYLGARRQSGISLLEAARWLSEARLEAKHGEWAIFLEAIGLDESRARAQIRIHEEAQRDSLFADRIINGFLSETVARELLPLPPETREELLTRETPPKREEIRGAKRAPAPVLEPFWQGLDAHHPTAHLWTRERPDLLRSACGMTIQNRLPSGSTEGGHCSSCVRATWPQNQAEAEEKPATCIRCGAERTHTRSLTSYQAGLIDAYPDRDVTLCSRCIPELLAAQRAAEQPTRSEVASATELTPEEQRIVTAAGYKWQSSDVHPGTSGKSVTYHLKCVGSGMGVSMTRPQFDAWLKIHAPIERTPTPAQPAASLPAVPPRPKRPISADASATFRYIDQLEAYARALEVYIMALQRQTG